MPRNVAGIYSLPPGVEAVDGELADPTAFNLFLNDFRLDANAVRPVGAGGTGASTLVSFADALGAVANLNTRTSLLGRSANLSDLANVGTAQTNLGITALGKTRITGTSSVTFTAGATNAQGSGPISATDQFVRITTSTFESAVTLPAFVAGDIGKTITIWHQGAFGVFLYPATGMTINAQAVNTSAYIPPDFVVELHYVSATNVQASIQPRLNYYYDSDVDPFGAWTYNWHPYNRTTRTGTGTGEFYNSTATVANVLSPDFEDGYEYMFQLRSVSSTGTGAFQMELFRETDAAYGSPLLLSGALAAATSYTFAIELPTVRRSQPAQIVHAYSTSQTVGAPATGLINAACVQNAQKRTRARLSFSTGSIDSLIAFMYRRRITL